MAIIRKTNLVKSFGDSITDTYLYEDTLYVMHYDTSRCYEVYKYRPGMHEELIYTYKRNVNDCYLLFKHNINDRPGLACLSHNDNVMTYHDILRGTSIELINLHIHVHYFEYRFYDKFIIIDDSANKELIIYNIDTHERVVHANFKSSLYDILSYDDKIYLMYEDYNNKKLTISSLVISTGEMATECIFDTAIYDNILYLPFMTVFKIDDIVYCGHRDGNTMICFDIKKKVQYKREYKMDYSCAPILNNRNTKLYAFIDCDVHEYDIIKETLFKSSSLAYNDMTIKTVSMDE